MIYFGKLKNSVWLKPNAEWKKDAKAPSSYIGTIGCRHIIKSDIVFLSPERAATYQPRAAPWVKIKQVF